MHAAYLSLQAASVQQPDECTFAAHAVSVMGLLHMLSQSWQYAVVGARRTGAGG